MKAGWFMRTAVLAAAGALVLTLVPTPAHAQTRTTPFDVTASVARNCLITATDMAFGAYDPIETHATVPLDSTSTVSVQCTRGSSGVWVGLDLGLNSSAGARRMISAGEYLTYELYTDAGRTTVWGNTQIPSNTWPVFPSRAPVAQTVYGRVPAAQDVVVGSYADTITATVNF